MNSRKLNVPDVHCDHCVNSIEQAVGALPGVDQVKVDLGERTVAVTYDETAVGLEDIVTAIEGQGYEVAS